MTHNFLRDKEYLRSLLDSPAAYIGMLGPAARTERLLMELRDEGVAITDEDRARIHGPAGLDLGAEGPEEIAQSIVAEIVAVRRARGGGFLKERPGPDPRPARTGDGGPLNLSCPFSPTHAISGCCHRLSATARRANRTRRVHGVAFQFRVSPAGHAGRGARCARLPR